jgi:hypothetical protein
VNALRTTPRTSVSANVIRWGPLLLAVFGLGTSGCLRTTLWSGRAPGAAAVGWEGRWHHGFVFGLNEVPGPIEPDVVCPEGWAEVDTSVDPLQFAIALGTLGIYVPTTVSVVCADPAAALVEPIVPGSASEGVPK